MGTACHCADTNARFTDQKRERLADDKENTMISLLGCGGLREKQNNETYDTNKLNQKFGKEGQKMVKGYKFNSVNIKSKEFREFRNHMKQ